MPTILPNPEGELTRPRYTLAVATGRGGVAHLRIWGDGATCGGGTITTTAAALRHVLEHGPRSVIVDGATVYVDADALVQLDTLWRERGGDGIAVRSYDREGPVWRVELEGGHVLRERYHYGRTPSLAAWSALEMLRAMDGEE